ncbi:protein usf-like isoform X2 [Mercenaria mercenaria]|nr:protein usf-like isoform X2 [Mercenaria mercenaria]XP_053382147.1 protein usf-like isoform X2 [Mercenaria mercenaria]
MIIVVARSASKGVHKFLSALNPVLIQAQKMSVIQFKSENAQGDCPGILHGDVSKTKKGVIVLQEWWGINDQIKDEAKDIGERGNFVTLVPDLYRGKSAIDKEGAGHLMSTLDWQGAVKDIQGAARYLLGLGCTKVGVTGFCMGGALSLAGAALVPEISAAAPFYGIPSPDLCDVSTIKIPVQAHFGEKDDIKGFSSKEDALALKEKMKDIPNFELFLYPDCGHAFTNKTGLLQNYNEKACNEALTRMTEFMNKFLA